MHNEEAREEQQFFKKTGETPTGPAFLEMSKLLN